VSEQGQPTEDELRAAYEAELKRLRVEDVLVQTVVSLLNLGARKGGLAPGSEDERDPEQMRMAIDGARALMPVVEPVLGPDAAQLREMLTQLQMAFTQLGGTPPPAEPPPAAPEPPQSSGRLWIPGQ
jgi:hypothetical protein